MKLFHKPSVMCVPAALHEENASQDAAKAPESWVFIPKRGFDSLDWAGAHFPAWNSAEKDLWRAEQAPEPMSGEQRGGEGQKKKANRINLNCNKITACIEISTFGINFFHQAKG